jgi:hypothetical protein
MKRLITATIAATIAAFLLTCAPALAIEPCVQSEYGMTSSGGTPTEEQSGYPGLIPNRPALLLSQPAVWGTVPGFTPPVVTSEESSPGYIEPEVKNAKPSAVYEEVLKYREGPPYSPAELGGNQWTSANFENATQTVVIWTLNGHGITTAYTKTEPYPKGLPGSRKLPPIYVGAGTFNISVGTVYSEGALAWLPSGGPVPGPNDVLGLDNEPWTFVRGCAESGWDWGVKIA